MFLVTEQDQKMSEPGFLKQDRQPLAREGGAQQGCWSTAPGEALRGGVHAICRNQREPGGVCVGVLPGRTNSPAAA